MFSNRNWIAVAFAVIIGIAAVILANSYLTGVQKRETAEAEAGRKIMIAVARTELTYGTVLTAENIRMVSWPASSMPKGAFDSTKKLLGGEQRVALRPIEVGEPILPGKITGPGGRASISNLIEPGMRAVAVRINDVAGVAGFVLPGDSVDVLVTREVAKGNTQGGNQITDLLLQNTRVIGVDQNANDASDQTKVGKTVTLSVDQLGAQKLALAGQVGSLSLALRNAANQESQPAFTVSADDLRDGIYGGNYSGSSGWAFAGNDLGSPAAVSYPSRSLTRKKGNGSTGKRRAKPTTNKRWAEPSPTVNVQVVRGTASSNYEVNRYGGF